MVALKTPEVNKGWNAPEFSLKGTDGNTYTLDDVRGEKGLVVMFICNHCPFVKAIFDKLVRDITELKKYGINAVAIMANDAGAYPGDSFENMQKLAEEKQLPFPYLYDETQEVAKVYDAVCTPDFFGFNVNLELQYRGRLDDSGVKYKPDGERELFNAMVQVAETGEGPAQQTPSIGCSIKWR